MKKLTSVLVAVILLFVPFFPASTEKADISTLTFSASAYRYDGISLSPSAQSAALYDATGGVFLYSKNCFEQLGMASTTKIMTGLLAVELLPLKSQITVSKSAVGIEGSSIYLAEGDVLTSESLIYGLLLESGNDAAVAIAVAISGSSEKFVELMNKRAAEIGLENTHFANPHGLSDPEHYTTARDLALLSAYAMSNETFRTVVSTRSASFKDVNSQSTRYYFNHNKLLSSYDGMIGIKTGYTQNTGRCLVTAAERDGRMLIAVTLNDSDDKAEHKAMLDYGFDDYKTVETARVGEYTYDVAVTGGTAESVKITNTVNGVAVLPNDSELSQPTLTLEPFVYAPVRHGDVIGAVNWYCDGVCVCRLPLVATESISVKRLSLFEKIKELLS